MAIATEFATEVDSPDAPPLETRPQRSGGWFRRLQQRVRLAMNGDDEELIVENKTNVSWRVYHDYHMLGIIDAGESRTFRLQKHGNLNVRPATRDDEVEYLVLTLTVRVHRVEIYRRQMAQALEIYDMRVA
ncbi:MAG TPA: hypothetical protein VKV20_05015 [Ktedonobacteraceae bacterium]|jgi:hypothetical protein|nr:hypothetical protein [Ktedonobacteraceae bacterium]